MAPHAQHEAVPQRALLGNRNWGLRMLSGTVGWYTVSVSLTLFNKWILEYWVPSFKFPVTMTACHMVRGLAGICLHCRQVY
jgi:hypothetical protein